MARSKPAPDTPPAAPLPDAVRSRRGFASMDPERLRAVSSKGGKAPHGAGPRGFARMDPERLRDVARQGSAAAHRGKLPASPWPDVVRAAADAADNTSNVELP